VKSCRKPATFGQGLTPRKTIDRPPVARALVGRMRHTEQVLNDCQPVRRRQGLGPRSVARPRTRAKPGLEKSPSVPGGTMDAGRRLFTHILMILDAASGNESRTSGRPIRQSRTRTATDM
jgi:hypothetical protein